MRISKAFTSLTLVATLALMGGCAADSGAKSDVTSPAQSNNAEGEAPIAIAFFGFAKANSFANATFAGIEEYAKANNATVEFFDGAFSAETQIQQMQDATTLGKYSVYIIQANDGAALIPAAEAATAAGIRVVAEYTPLGTAYDTADVQVKDTYALIDVPVDNGKALAALALSACSEVKTDPCKVAYLQGNAALPLDTARTAAVVDALKAGGVEVFDNLQGGYTADEGRQAGQDLLQSHPDVNVIIGSSQAIAGVETLVEGKDVKLIGNGSSKQAVEAVQSGAWYGIYYLDEVANGVKAAEVGIAAARGSNPPASINLSTLDTAIPKGTKDALAGITGSYDE